MKTDDNFEFGQGIKIWLIICIIGNLVSTIINLSLGNVSFAVVKTWITILYVLLFIKKKRIIFALILTLIIVLIIMDLITLGNPIQASLKLLNPLITYILLQKYWKKMR
ncbi:hypothetical protein RZO55_22845 [Clostridium boliviensis]|uniref:DUF5658 domain-containing protein n=1 Tax=Clostridium boliviensis TaxID=318465 RepID=A0ABU4GRZ3_9CLOT|nr:hypothetical protein [Clostridium boliviensis]MDW2800410.1 hypothetical protein [Clostridium boliviensis]